MRRHGLLLFFVFLAFPAVRWSAFCQSTASAIAPLNGSSEVIFDTDIGDDIDDAFALALLLSAPQVKIDGVTAAWGDTALRARLAARLLHETGHEGIAVAAGPKTQPTATFSQATWATNHAQPAAGWPDAVQLMLERIRKNPGHVTLISVAPLSNVGALIDADPATFRELKQVVVMGGSIHRRYGDLGYLPDRGPEPEYNIKVDISAARKLFSSGVPLYVMPLDSTQLKLDEIKRGILFSADTPATNALASLYYEWSASTGNPTPTLFDAMAVAAYLQPSLCPTTPLRIEVDDQGYTRVAPGAPNANVCLESSPDGFFHFYLGRLLKDADSRASGQP